MANIQERSRQDGTLAFLIRVTRGRDSNGKQLKPFITTYIPDPSWTYKTARKKAEAYAAIYEKSCKEGKASDSKMRFSTYFDYVLELKEHNGVKHGTIVRYKELAERILPEIGHYKLQDIHTKDLNALVLKLSKAPNKKTGSPLSPKTVIEHHRLISTVLQQAVKEGLIPFNPSNNVTLPKVSKPEVNYYQPETISAITAALNSEDIKWRTLVTFLMISGARRGEILGLKWDRVNFDKNEIYICNNVVYTPDRGIYEETPKTKRSQRYISMPPETMSLLRAYRKYQIEKRMQYAQGYYEDNGFVFCQDNGKPLHPDSVNDFLRRFSQRHDLPHLNPHAFRHTMTSLLFFNGLDVVSISARLGHANVSTTENAYAHVIESANSRSADLLAQIYLKRVE